MHSPRMFSTSIDYCNIWSILEGPTGPIGGGDWIAFDGLADANIGHMGEMTIYSGDLLPSIEEVLSEEVGVGSSSDLFLYMAH